MHGTDQETLRLLRDSARDFCAGISLHTGRDLSPGWWRDIALLGWLAVSAPEEAGGAGMGLIGAGAIAHELGRAGYTRGYAETVALAHALRRGRGAGYLPALAALDQALQDTMDGTVQLALLKPRGPHTTVEGLVADADAAGLHLLTFDDTSGLVLHQLGVQTRKQLARTTSRARDLFVEQRDGSFGNDCIHHALTKGSAARRLWQEAEMFQRVLISAQLVGVVRTALAITLDYTKIRSQFGRTIGAYQAVQHAVVDILATCDAAESLVERALAAIDAGRADQASLADAATTYARETAWTSLMKTYDVLGGVGFIELHPINRYTRCMMLSLASVGSASACEDATASHVRPGHWLVV